jgi:hypothetical protein
MPEITKYEVLVFIFMRSCFYLEIRLYRVMPPASRSAMTTASSAMEPPVPAAMAETVVSPAVAKTIVPAVMKSVMAAEAVVHVIAAVPVSEAVMVPAVTVMP